MSSSGELGLLAERILTGHDQTMTTRLVHLMTTSTNQMVCFESCFSLALLVELFADLKFSDCSILAFPKSFHEFCIATDKILDCLVTMLDVNSHPDTSPAALIQILRLFTKLCAVDSSFQHLLLKKKRVLEAMEIMVPVLEQDVELARLFASTFNALTHIIGIHQDYTIKPNTDGVLSSRNPQTGIWYCGRPHQYQCPQGCTGTCGPTEGCFCESCAVLNAQDRVLIRDAHHPVYDRKPASRAENLLVHKDIVSVGLRIIQHLLCLYPTDELVVEPMLNSLALWTTFCARANERSAIDADYFHEAAFTCQVPDLGKLIISLFQSVATPASSVSSASSASSSSSPEASASSIIRYHLINIIHNVFVRDCTIDIGTISKSAAIEALTNCSDDAHCALLLKLLSAINPGPQHFNEVLKGLFASEVSKLNNKLDVAVQANGLLNLWKLSVENVRQIQEIRSQDLKEFSTER